MYISTYNMIYLIYDMIYIYIILSRGTLPGIACLRAPFSSLQAFDGVEICSGTGILSRVLRDGGYKVCNVDIVDWASYFELHKPRTSGNPLDLLTPAGMSLLD